MNTIEFNKHDVDIFINGTWAIKRIKLYIINSITHAMSRNSETMIIELIEF